MVQGTEVLAKPQELFLLASDSSVMQSLTSSLTWFPSTTSLTTGEKRLAGTELLEAADKAYQRCRGHVEVERAGDSSEAVQD